MLVRRLRHDMKLSNPKEFLKNIFSIKSYRQFCKIIIWSWNQLWFPSINGGVVTAKHINNFVMRRDVSKLIADSNSWDRKLSYEPHIIFFLHKRQKSILCEDILVVKLSIINGPMFYKMTRIQYFLSVEWICTKFSEIIFLHKFCTKFPLEILDDFVKFLLAENLRKIMLFLIKK